MLTLERMMLNTMWVTWVSVITAEMMLDAYHELIYGRDERNEKDEI